MARGALEASNLSDPRTAGVPEDVGQLLCPRLPRYCIAALSVGSFELRSASEDGLNAVASLPERLGRRAEEMIVRLDSGV